MNLDDHIAIQQQDFDLGTEYARLAADDAAGAVVSFVGKVRAANEGSDVTGLCLEHYPGMSEAALQALVAEARSRWPLRGCTLLHRIGNLACGAQIVLVVVSSAHRQAAFEAARYLMDQLKTRVPLWKKEQLADGSQRDRTVVLAQGQIDHGGDRKAAFGCEAHLQAPSFVGLTIVVWHKAFAPDPVPTRPTCWSLSKAFPDCFRRV